MVGKGGKSPLIDIDIDNKSEAIREDLMVLRGTINISLANGHMSMTERSILLLKGRNRTVIHKLYYVTIASLTVC